MASPVLHFCAAAIALAVLVGFGGLAARADEPPLPRPRPEASEPKNSATELPGSQTPRPEAPPLPSPRPTGLPPSAPESEAPTSADAAPEPQVYQTACPAVLSGTVIATSLLLIDDGVCQARSPLAVTGLHVGGREVKFSTPAIVACPLAGQLAEWVSRVDAHAGVMFTSPIAELLVGTSYDCRQRNNEMGAKVSEHGFADAVDITGFRLENGTLLSLPEDWAGDGAEARALRYAHDAACGLFTTVLGPDANEEHRDHIHLDLGCHGARCTFRICE